MFTPIDFDAWERKEIYQRFYGYSYTVTADVDITAFLLRIRNRGFKFYPSICYALTKVVNENRDFRYGKMDGKIGFWDTLDTHYTLLRKDTALFTHMVTAFTEDPDRYHRQFITDKEAAEAGSSLYYNNASPIDTFHISIIKTVKFTSLSLSKPASYTHSDSDTTSFVPFATIGKYETSGTKTLMPLAVEFNHSVNDGYHAGVFFEKVQECLDTVLL
ncbi:CatA-like O-acetyltransferase [Breznakiella homolactica]|uniref:Chloramphenicol acetyltransferase n=1 Tax=Breznakiella homolactica TaxID=2798577 RepID=A0A7T7XNX9_9SPIR|nr:CatA-like O-acetyltransferase [Breznakiella homolactica]QQO09747.1 hypothetical protein JFL75_02205 [Breznakiella homolactica]